MSAPRKKPAGKKSRDNKSTVRASSLSPARYAGFKALQQVFKGQSLSTVQFKIIDDLEDSRDRALAYEIINGVLRWRWRLAAYLAQCMDKALKPKDFDVQIVLMMAVYELSECRSAEYAVINQSVELVRKARKRWADRLVNAVLRRFLREKEVIVADAVASEAVEYSHPQWIINKLKHDWPKHWTQILKANNQRAPIWLRVNARQSSTEAYLALLGQSELFDEAELQRSELSPQAIKISRGMDITRLPGFDSGAVSVQDAGAQLCADLLNVSAGHRLLDVCAAPGGKTCHLLETHADIAAMVAVELEAKRMQRVEDNLQRLQLFDESQSCLVVADARDYRNWWQGELFDRILLDAPCSASGVIRRHPDIKSLRRDTDIAPLVKLQAEILESCWQMLKTDGELLYVTCSVFKDENQQQISCFLKQYSDAEEITLEGKAWGIACEHGRQLMPGEMDADGFYFCKLKKKS